MFTPLVLRRNLSVFHRLPRSRILRTAAHEQVPIQRVRIRRPFFSKSRLVGTVAIGVATYGLGRYVGIKVEVEEIKEGERTATRSDGQPGQDGWTTVGQDVDDEDEDDEYDDAILFLPTGFSRLRPRTFYKGSDPEWQEFKKLAADRPRVDKIRGEMVSTVRNAVARSPVLVARVGKIDMSKGLTWIDFKFPDTTPDEYERPGIELVEDLSWRKTTRPVESAHHHRLNRLLYPKEAANALYKDTSNKAGRAWKDFKIYMGWDQESKTETVQQLVQRIGANPRSSANQMTSVTANPLSTSAKDSQQPGVPPSAAPIDGPAKDLGLALPDPKKMTLDLSQFRTDFRKTFKQYPLVVPRGAFMVLGLIEVYGERAKLTLDVHAVYDPKQGRYVGMHIRPWNFVELKQSPKGGP